MSDPSEPNPGAPALEVDFVTVVPSGSDLGTLLNADIADSELDAIMSEAARELGQTRPNPGVLFAPDSQAASIVMSALTERGLDANAWVETLPVAKVAMDNHDYAGWSRAAYDLVRGKLHLLRKAPFKPVPDASTAHQLPNRARLAILGDWGTGLYGAPRCATSIAADRGGFEAIIHLGDVYYSGTDNEVEQRFLNHWPWLPGTINRACNSNHEMYGGGHAYFNKTLPAFEQDSSVFLLRNDFWVVIGLDTAYDDFSLHAQQVQLLEDAIRLAGTRRILLLSHHQLFSHQSDQGNQLQTQLRHILESRAITAWYWGHEHRAVLYEAHPDWSLLGRCVGHSGYPYFRFDHGSRSSISVAQGGDEVFVRFAANDQVPEALVLDGPNPYVYSDPNRYGPNGYLTIDLDDAGLTESLRRPDGTIIRTNSI